jgi:PAS domain-containing protein
MSLWIDTADINVLKVALQHTSAQHLISTIDGGILWANRSFTDWSKYTVHELMNMTWMDFSVDDPSLAADIEEAAKLDGYQTSYTVQKQYIPKNSKPEIGLLHVVRYPLGGAIECCICTWEPLKNGTAEAYRTSLAYFKRIDEKLAMLTSQTEEDIVLLGVFKLVKKYPKAAIAVLIFLIGIFGTNNILQILQGIGYLPEPTRQVELKK